VTFRDHRVIHRFIAEILWNLFLEHEFERFGTLAFLGDSVNGGREANNS